MAKLEGKTALITGGNSGIGLATAKQFVNEGAYVFITGRREPELAAAVKEIRRNVNAIRGDVSNLEETLKSTELAEARVRLTHC
jgi:NAD(P)-dependent dehydrogenase (short-subunit alcohol dehydrogenase family)